MSVTQEANGLYRCATPCGVYWGRTMQEAIIAAMKLEDRRGCPKHHLCGLVIDGSQSTAKVQLVDRWLGRRL